MLLEEGTGIYKVCDFGSCTTNRVCCETDADVAALKADIELNTTCTYRAPEMLNLQIGSVVGIEVDIWVHVEH